MKIQINIVIMEQSDPKTTSCPAKSPSPSICWAIIKEDTAAGEPNSASSTTSSAPRNPNRMPIVIKMRGTATSLPPMPIISCLPRPFILENVKDAPSKKSARGVATPPISSRMPLIIGGILMLDARNRTA